MKFRIGYLAATIVLAAIDGAFLSGLAAVISAVGTIILGLLAHRQGKAEAEAEAEVWKQVAADREAELDELRAAQPVRRRRRAPTGGGA